MDAVRVMAKARTAVEGARAIPDGMSDQEHVLGNTDAFGLFSMMGLAHALRTVVLHLDARDEVAASWVAAADLEEARRGPQPEWPCASNEAVHGCMLCVASLRFASPFIEKESGQQRRSRPKFIRDKSH
jgi:hypothetical protein